MKNPVTEKLIAAVNKRGASGKDESAFLRDYYHRLSGQDFTVEQAAAYLALALRHRRLGETRAARRTLIEIYNPAAKDEPLLGRRASVINIVAADKPFIIDSLTIKLNAMGKTLHRITHPNFEVSRSKNDKRRAMWRVQGKAVDGGGGGEGDIITVETYIQFIIDFTAPGEHAALLRELREVLADIDIVVADWGAMRRYALSLAARLDATRAGGGGEHGDLLRWMENHNFAFLGYAEMEISASGKVTPADGTALGVLRALGGREPAAVQAILPPPPREAAKVVFTKARARAGIHREDYFDCILVEPEAGAAKPAAKRRVSCILGFLAGSARLLPTAAIPHLRNKTAYILRESTLRPGGYAYKALQAVLETLPREKLFQMEARSLYALSMTVLNHLQRRRTRVHLHRNTCGHVYSCLVYVPRELFDSTLRRRIQAYLGEQLDAAEVSFDVYFSDSILTRIHYLVHCRQRRDVVIDGAALENAVGAMARSFNDNLHQAILDAEGHEAADLALTRWRDAFPSAYRDVFDADQARLDLTRLAHTFDGDIHAVLTDRDGGDRRTASFKLYSDAQSTALSDVLPILDNMGIRVLGDRPYRIIDSGDAVHWLHDFEITRHDRKVFDLERVAAHFQTTFTEAWGGRIENDGFNQLTLLAGLSWKEVSLLRAYFRYLKQIRLRYSEQYIVDALVANPALVVAIINYCHARFDPARQSAPEASRRKLRDSIDRQIEQVATLDEERIVRALVDVIDATLRTNYYQTDADGGGDKPYLAFKLASDTIPRIPQPAPKFEIFVHSPRLEGVHLRGGKVARGGLRWSERPEDFRTEVLGLVKAQRVKNAVIVPVGSKGGFVARQLPAGGSREEVQQEVVACYRLFISALLDLTDNLIKERVAPPPDVVRLDGDDPYLVVAADKGTAAFSDIANQLSADYGFWLGDAFASGGSAGYDHKKMGITARGAWESVKRHFRELGKDIQRTDFSVVGIGDMGGDVFGNGMLLSRHIRLVAAFNHMHIFIDPAPNAATSFRERQRLFRLPRSSWADYNQKLISAGGGIYERSAKSITLSAQAKQALGAERAKYTPNELLRLILAAEVELLWNGGIGTYVKAAHESHSAAQDKANDEVRVDAADLRCRVIGEGGNLGVTQLARVEFAQHGGLCYTDAIDNSAGVDTSDHEVNIKILLGAAMRAGKLEAPKRDALLAGMEQEVAELVLHNNYSQAQSLSLAAADSTALMAQQCRAIDVLEDKGLLNREIEFLPPRAVLAERREEGNPLTRPELAVLLSYAKMDLYQSLLDSEVPDDDYLATEIDRYFPPALARDYPQLVRAHRLKREIISTQITNQLVGAMGADFHLRMADLTGADAATVTRAYAIARDLLDAPALTAAVCAPANSVSAAVQLDMLRGIRAALTDAVAWLLRNQMVDASGAAAGGVSSIVAAFAPGCRQLRANPAKTLAHDRAAAEAITARQQQLLAAGAAPPLAAEIAALPTLAFAFDIIHIATARKRPLSHAATAYFQLRELLRLGWLERAIDALPGHNHWHERARFSLATDLRASHAAITARVLTTKTPNATAAAAVKRWQATNQAALDSLTAMTHTLAAEHTPDFAMLSVPVGELTRLS